MLYKFYSKIHREYISMTPIKRVVYYADDHTYYFLIAVHKSEEIFTNVSKDTWNKFEYIQTEICQ